MKRIIPGHIRAYTFWLVIALIIYLLIKDIGIDKILWIILAFISVFLGDHATHLAQNEHSGVPPTWIEKELQSKGLFYKILSIVLAIIFIGKALG